MVTASWPPAEADGDVEGFDPYVDQLSILADVPPAHRDGAWRDRSAAALDGQPSDVLRRTVPLETRRRLGAFFTGAELADVAVRQIAHTFNKESVILDPACGVGDLLIACASGLSRQSDARVEDWGHRLVGRDVQPTFVRAAQLRLKLKAIELGLGTWSQRGAERLFFSNIRTGCGLVDRAAIRNATHILMNPPFARIPAPADCQWAGGSVSSAGLFLSHCVAHAMPGTRVVAILPDVLRSGWRYRKWRAHITNRSRIVSIRRQNRFARWADVHVFILNLVVQEPRKRVLVHVDWDRSRKSVGSVGDHFRIGVGSVVHFRHPQRGAWKPYVVSGDLPAWEKVESITRHRRYSGRLISPPFVVVRRTSRPEHPHRAVGTLIVESRPVAVDNHLLVLVPKDGTERSCQTLLRTLRHESTNTWFNRRIRCRHLTVDALRDLPWIAE